MSPQEIVEHFIKSGKEIYDDATAVCELSLLTELNHFGDVIALDMQGSKALRIANKCRRRGHPALADKITEKWGRFFPKSDMAMAFGYAMKLRQQLKK